MNLATIIGTIGSYVYLLARRCKPIRVPALNFALLHYSIASPQMLVTN